MEGIPELLSVDNIANGALHEILQDEFKKMAANINDPNTAANQKRKITLEIEATPFPDRTGATYSVKCSTKLAGMKPVEGSMYIIRRNGEFLVCPRNTKQQEMQFDMQSTAANDTTLKQ